jgi:hypothetical protein
MSNLSSTSQSPRLGERTKITLFTNTFLKEDYLREVTFLLTLLESSKVSFTRLLLRKRIESLPQP